MQNCRHVQADQYFIVAIVEMSKSLTVYLMLGYVAFCPSQGLFLIHIQMGGHEVCMGWLRITLVPVSSSHEVVLFWVTLSCMTSSQVWESG